MGGDEGEARWVARAKAGDDVAFAALCRSAEGLVRSRIRSVLSPPVLRKVDLDDVVQDTWIAAHARLPEFEYRGEGAFGAWAARIAELSALATSRRYSGVAKRDVGREVTKPGRPDTLQFRGPTATPSQQAMAGERAEAIDAARKALPDDYRRVLALVQDARLTFDEAAAAMGRSRPAVAKLYARALARLVRLAEGTDEN